MRKVLFVPADAAARERYPQSHLRINTARNPAKGDGGKGKGRRPVTVPEAVQRAGARGWVRLTELPPAEQKRWRAAFRNAKRTTITHRI